MNALTHLKKYATARLHDARLLHNAKGYLMAKDKAEIEHLHARMIVFVGCTIAVTFAITVIGFVYGLLFVTQPL